MRGAVWASLLAAACAAALACVDFGAALEVCEESGRCAPDDGGAQSPDAGPAPDGGGVDAGCVDEDGDGRGPGCGLPDCDDGDPLRPEQAPCEDAVFVCATCIGAEDDNEGTPASPLQTISAGIARAQDLGRSLVQVANSNAFTATVYEESFDMVEGVSVEGRYYLEDGVARLAGGVRTVLHNTRTEGVVFPEGLTRATRLSGFQIRSFGGQDATAITIRGSSPTLSDLIAGQPLSPSENSYGIRVEPGDGGVRPNPAIHHSLALAQAAFGEAVGIWISGGAADLRGGSAQGGALLDGGAAIGLRLEDGAGTRVTEVTLIGCVGNPPGLPGGTCRAFQSTGDASGVTVAASALYGCFDECPLQGTLHGAAISVCGSMDAGAPLTLARNPLITGARLSSQEGVSRGIVVSEGCAVSIRDNGLITAADSAGDAGNLAGVQCTQGAGPGPRCSVHRNVIRSHRVGAPDPAYGVLCGCAGCDGGCTDLIGNTVDVLGTGNFHTVWVEGHSPLVARNRINMGQTDQTCQIGRGLVLIDSHSRVENNFIRGGGCKNSVGVVHHLNVPGPGAFLHSNSITGGIGTANVAIAVHVSAAPGVPAFGRYWNNVLSTANTPGSAAIRHAMTFIGDAQPSEVRHNLLHANGAAAVVWTGWGATPVSHDLAQVNAQAWGGENLSAEPGFTGWRNFYLAQGSAARDAGTRLHGPVDDIDGQLRPAPDAGFLPAIGADEPSG